MGIDYVGTAKTNRTGGACVNTKSFFKKKDKGSYRAEEKRGLYCVQWLDNKVVTIMSTHPFPVGRITRKTVNKRSREFTQVWLECPAIVSVYNRGKVGTDRMDQMVAAYYKNRRLRWHLKVMIHIFYIATFNTYTTWRDLNRVDGKLPPTGLLDFLEKLLHHFQGKEAQERADQAQGHTPMEPVQTRLQA